MIPHLAFVGWSGSGKTTLLQQVVAILSGQGLAVAVIKHGHHEVEEAPGKDTARYRESGATRVVYAGPTGLSLWQGAQDPPSLDSALALIDGVDVVLVEGFKREPGPKVEVRRGSSTETIATPENGLLAVVSDQPAPEPGLTGVEWLDINAPEQVAKFIMRYLAAVAARSERGGTGVDGA